MTDYMPFSGFEGHNLEETHMMGYALMSENACDGYQQSIQVDVPGSPSSVSSDWSVSTATTACMSQPSSPAPSEDEVVEKKPLKSSLRRTGAAPRKRRVTWDPSVVFETRPWSGKRRRSQVDDGQEEEVTENMNGSYDGELKAPIPTKRAKLAEIEDQAVHQTSLIALHLLPSISPPVFPEASRTVIPSFNFSSLISKDSHPLPQAHIPAPSSAPLSTGSHSLFEAQPPLISRPSFVPFTFVSPKRNLSTSHSNLRL